MKKEETATTLIYIRELLQEKEPDIKQMVHMINHLLIQGPCAREMADIKEAAILILERLTLPALTKEREKQAHVTRLIRTIRKSGQTDVVELLTMIEKISPWIAALANQGKRGEIPPPFSPELIVTVLQSLNIWNPEELPAPDIDPTNSIDGWQEIYRLLGRIIIREHRARTAWAREKKALQDAIAAFAEDLVESSLMIGRKESAGETWVRDLTEEILIKPETVMNALLEENSAIWTRVQEVETALTQSQTAITQFQTLLRQAEQALMATKDETLIDTFTGLPNRFAFMARLAQAMEPAPGEKYPSAPFALIFIRVDEYAEMIETLGRDRVNRVMSALASKINSLLQCEEYLARWSEETFALLYPNVLTAVALTLATTLQKVLNPIQFELSDALVTMRLGFGVVPHQPDMTEEHLLNLAELKAKAALQEGALSIQVAEEKISSVTK